MALRLREGGSVMTRRAATARERQAREKDARKNERRLRVHVERAADTWGFARGQAQHINGQRSQMSDDAEALWQREREWWRKADDGHTAFRRALSAYRRAILAGAGQ